MKKKIAFALVIGVITTGPISFTLTSINVGYMEQFLFVWLRAWGTAYIVAVPAILVIGPKVQQLVDRLFDEQVVLQKE